MQRPIISGDEDAGNREGAEAFDSLPVTPDSRTLLDSIFSVAFEELQRLAASVKRSGPNVTLSPATLVNEAWIKLSKSSTLAFESKLHFNVLPHKPCGKS